MRSSEATLDHLRSAASPSTLQVHWIDDTSLIPSRPSGHRTRAELPPPESLAMAQRRERLSARRLQTSSRVGDLVCRCPRHHQDLHRATRGHKVLDLVMTPTARQATLQRPQRADLAKQPWDLFHQHRWDGKTSQRRLQHRHRHHHYQDLQQLTVSMSTRARESVAMASMSHHIQKRRANRRFPVPR
jgi:hypothetical protein